MIGVSKKRKSGANPEIEPGAMGDFKVGVSVGVYCTKCTLNTSVDTNFEITHWICSWTLYPFVHGG
jgi:hypothetical protein